MVRITVQPQNHSIDVAPGTPLQDVLFDMGVEFPCGGKGLCRGCRILLKEGDLLVTEAQKQKLTPEEIHQGWRLACCCCADTDLVIDVAQWEMPILADRDAFSFTPQQGLGIAVDVGTTTVVTQLVDLTTAQVLSVASGLNPQAQFGSDIMSRLEYAQETSRARNLQDLIRGTVAKQVDQVMQGNDLAQLQRIVLVGNTAMHHLFAGIDVAPLASFPFQSPALDGVQYTAEELAWRIPSSVSVHFLPCLGGFVGSDILAGIVATGLQQERDVVGLVDLGTNGEIVIAHEGKLLCASTAAGPAFEGGRISQGMRATAGAIHQVHQEKGFFRVKSIGKTPPRGICGSGLVDAVATALHLNILQGNGRLSNKDEPLQLHPKVALQQKDIRELQLAKAAIAAGIKILLEQAQKKHHDLKRLYVAGAFGNYLNITNAQKIGLLPFDEDVLAPVGNSALRGAKMFLFYPGDLSAIYQPIRESVEHLSLNHHPRFQDVYVDEMFF